MDIDPSGPWCRSIDGAGSGTFLGSVEPSVVWSYGPVCERPGAKIPDSSHVADKNQTLLANVNTHKKEAKCFNSCSFGAVADQ